MYGRSLKRRIMVDYLKVMILICIYRVNKYLIQIIY